MPTDLPSLNALKAFEVVARCRSITRAAAVLHVTPGAVSRQLKQLERELGETLVIRGPRQTGLTPSGERLMETVAASLEQMRQTVGDLRAGRHRRRLALNIPSTLASRWVMPRLHRLRAQDPALVLSIRTETKDRLSQRDELDAAIRFGTGDWPNLHSSHLFSEEHVAVAAPGVQQALTRRDGTVVLSEATLLHVLKREGRYLSWQHWLDAAGIDGVDAGKGFEFDTLDLAIEAAIAGLGAAIADWHMVADDLAAGRLVQLFETRVPGTRSYWWVRPPEASPTGALETFERWLRATLETHHA
ncbi:LysR substrate-binding domain-containing protein [Spiribacter sp. 1M153]|uniref:LysR substrate-binding domain-containing protein n=1 Tax=Spiribacter roseus TaxID=1855875 RepID=UPI00349F99F3